MILALASSSESSLSWGWPVAASIGGLIVFAGLLLEKAADWMDENFIPQGYKPHKTLGQCGWAILMLGILVEIGIGFTLAAKDEIVEKQTAEQIAQTSTNVAIIDPLNQPLASCVASVVLEVRGTNQIYIDTAKTNANFVVLLDFGSSKHSPVSWSVSLYCTAVKKEMFYDMTDWFFEFNPNEFGEHGFEFAHSWNQGQLSKYIVRDVNEWDLVEVESQSFPDGMEISRGEVTLIVNSKKRTFPIPPQKPLDFADPRLPYSVTIKR